MTAKDNLSLWTQVEQTDPNHITVMNRGQSTQRNTIKAHFQKERATELFGVYGLDWGVEVGTEEYSRNNFGDVHLLHYTAVMYYTFKSKQGRMPIAASIKECYVSNKGKLIVDHEAIKKVRTDALTKGLSELGFNADIYKGYHDQAGYEEYVASEIAEAAQEKAEDEAIAKAEEYKKWKEKAVGEFALVNTVKAVNTFKTKFIRKATAMGDNNAIKMFSEAADIRIEELKEAAKAES